MSVPKNAAYIVRKIVPIVRSLDWASENNVNTFSRAGPLQELFCSSFAPGLPTYLIWPLLQISDLVLFSGWPRTCYSKRKVFPNPKVVEQVLEAMK